jgi:hypothetical protein
MPTVSHVRQPKRQEHMPMAQIRLRDEGRQLKKYCAMARLQTEGERAKFCAVAPSTWHRVLTGLRAPSGVFIAGVVDGFSREFGLDPGEVFKDCFETTASDVTDDGEAA